MGLSYFGKAVGFTLGFATYVAAQLIGELTFDGAETMVLTISNPTADNFSMIGSNDLFDAFNEVPFAPLKITDITGKPVTLNGTRYRVPPLTEDAFKSLPPNGEFKRALNMSNYILGVAQPDPAIPSTAALDTKSECLVASLPPSLYGVNTTGIEPGEALANYYLTKGLITVHITSFPLHFNYTIPADFTTDQAKYIAADAAQRIAEATGLIGPGTGTTGVAATASSRRRRRAQI